MMLKKQARGSGLNTEPILIGDIIYGMVASNQTGWAKRLNQFRDQQRRAGGDYEK